MKCPICKEHGHEIEMLTSKKDFYACPACKTEVWPAAKYQPTWGVKRVKKKSASRVKAKRYNRTKKFFIPWYKRD